LKKWREARVKAAKKPLYRGSLRLECIEEDSYESESDYYSEEEEEEISLPKVKVVNRNAPKNISQLIEEAKVDEERDPFDLNMQPEEKKSVCKFNSQSHPYLFRPKEVSKMSDSSLDYSIENIYDKDERVKQVNTVISPYNLRAKST